MEPSSPTTVANTSSNSISQVLYSFYKNNWIPLWKQYFHWSERSIQLLSLFLLFFINQLLYFISLQLIAPYLRVILIDEQTSIEYSHLSILFTLSGSCFVVQLGLDFISQVRFWRDEEWKKKWNGMGAFWKTTMLPYLKNKLFSLSKKQQNDSFQNYWRQIIYQGIWNVLSLWMILSALDSLLPLRFVVLSYSKFIFLPLISSFFPTIFANIAPSTPVSASNSNFVKLLRPQTIYLFALTLLFIGLAGKTTGETSILLPNSFSFWHLYEQWIGILFLIVGITASELQSNYFGSSANFSNSSEEWNGDINLQVQFVSCLLCLPFIIIQFIFQDTHIYLGVYHYCVLFFAAIGFLLVPHLLEKGLIPFILKNVNFISNSQDTLLPDEKQQSQIAKRAGLESLFIEKRHIRFSFKVLFSFLLGLLLFGFSQFHFLLLVGLLLLIYVERTKYLKMRREEFISYSYAPSASNSSPLFNSKFREMIYFIISNKDSRYLFIYLCINLLFMLVEFFYGLYSNSLGLISDSAHMLFDSGALAIGLYGSFMAKWKPNDSYTYGYTRFETLSGFVNGLLLVFIGIYISFESTHRLFDPPKIEGQRLLLISILGFFINLSGVYFFHGESGHNDNMYGVYLHMIADALGSIGVIISTFIIQYYEFYLADPICSFIISIMILSTSIPLLKHGFQILLQRWPLSLDQKLTKTVTLLQQWDEIIEIETCHFWAISSDTNVGSIKLKIKEHVNEQSMQKKMNDLFHSECQIHDLTVQLEKPSQQLQSLSETPTPKRSVSNLEFSTHLK